MTFPLIIRPVASTDFTQWEQLWRGYNSFYGRVGSTALPNEITLITWSRFFDAYEPVYAMVAEKNDQLLGLAHYIFHRSTIMMEPVCYLQDLFTEEHARGQGIGRALIESVYEKARDVGAQRVYWQTHETNLMGMKLYDKIAERSGFIVYRKQL